MTDYLSDLGRRQAIHVDVHLLLHLLLHLAKAARRQSLSGWGFWSIFLCPKAPSRITYCRYHGSWYSAISEMCQPLWLLSPCQSGQSALAPASVVQNSPQRNGPAVLPTIVIIHDRSSLNILTVNWWSMKNNKLCLCCTLQWTSMVNGSCTLVDCIFYCSGPHFGSSAGCETCCRGRWLAISDQCSFSDATRTKETWKKGRLSG